MHLGALTTQASPRRARQSAVVAVLPIVTCDVDSDPYRAFFRAPPFISSGEKAWHQSTPPQDSSRQREPERRSPAQSAGKAERSDRRAREDYGWGWAGGITKPDQLPLSPTTPHHIRGSVSVSVNASIGVAIRRNVRKGTGRTAYRSALGRNRLQARVSPVIANRRLRLHLKRRHVAHRAAAAWLAALVFLQFTCNRGNHVDGHATITKRVRLSRFAR